ncbi:MAG: FAD-dependent oxidoreductase [Anaerolineae bacterium]|nr:FAD-dependent oxidoreductase [Anaerolineae bacterium]MDW8170902.1 NAD(P)/FAD-dependent oxidoreductase [Anaerolineae bacterium]
MTSRLQSIRQVSRRDFLKWSAGLLLTSSVGDLSLIHNPARARRSTDVLVIGAGAAGLSAAQSLHAEGLGVIVLEARERLGGRMWSDYDLAPYPIELGAEFLHGSTVSTWDWIVKTKLNGSRDKGETFYVYLDSLLQPDWSLQRDYLAELEAALEDWDGDEDAPISALLSDLRLSDEEVRLLNNLFAPDNAADLDEYGIFGYNEATFEGDGTGDWRVVEGYSALARAMADGLDVRLNSIVQRIAWDADGVEVTTQDGAIYEATKLIVTLPLGVLQRGSVTFDPELPSWKQRAIQRLGVGIVNKLILKFREPVWPDDLSVLATPLSTQLWWRPGFDREEEIPIMTALIGGSSGAAFSRLSQQEAIQSGLADLERMLGRRLSGLLVEGRFVNWGADPHSLMGYSYAPPGTVGLRRDLARDVQGVLYFAGEATNTTHPGTVHGAIDSGEEAAHTMLVAWR